MKKIIIALTVIGLAFCLSGPLSAQPSPETQGNGNPIGGPPIGGSAPIDGGVAILVALGAAYGARRWYAFQKEKIVQE